MSLRQNVLGCIEQSQVGKLFLREPRCRMVLTASLSFLLNLLYAIYHGILGILELSLWFFILCAYYILLSTMRFSAVLCERRNRSDASIAQEYFVMKLSGALLILLSLILSGMVFISLTQNIAAKHDKIIMITIAAYTFFKLIMAAVRAFRQRKKPSPLLAVIRSISYAEIAASVLTLQRSMLVSFGSKSAADAYGMNLLTGSGVCLFVFVLGAAITAKGIKGGEKHGKVQLRQSK